MKRRQIHPQSMIVGTGIAVPKKILTNYDLEKMVDTSNEWITTRTGMKCRAIAEDGELTSDLCAEASLNALEDAKVTPSEIDMIILGSVTGDVKFPATACYVQQKIGAANAVAFDISAACSGFLYGMSIANQMLLNHHYKNILIIGAEILSSIVDWKDRNTCVLFGDGAGACIMQRSTGERGILGIYMRSDGSLTDLLVCEGGGTKYPFANSEKEKKLFYISMKGREVFMHAIRNMGEACEKVLETVGISSDEVDLLIPHQANIRIIEALAKRVHIPMEKVFVNLDRYGNTSAASIPLALHEALKEGRLRDGQKCLIVVFGGGFTWGSALIQF